MDNGCQQFSAVPFITVSSVDSLELAGKPPTGTGRLANWFGASGRGGPQPVTSGDSRG